MAVGIARSRVCRRIAAAGGVALLCGTAAAAVEVTGARLSLGNAVSCPTIRADDGTVHAVSYLPPSVAVGERVTVRGAYAVTTRCVGRVIVVEEESLAEPARGDAPGR
jgi:hypothetical protein